MGAFHLESGLFGEKNGPETHNKQFIERVVYLRIQVPGCNMYSQRYSALVWSNIKHPAKNINGIVISYFPEGINQRKV